MVDLAALPDPPGSPVRVQGAKEVSDEGSMMGKTGETAATKKAPPSRVSMVDLAAPPDPLGSPVIVQGAKEVYDEGSMMGKTGETAVTKKAPPNDTVIVAEGTLGPEENAEEAAVPGETAVNEMQKEVTKEVIVARVVVDSEIHKKDGRGETKET
ncbi:hypothetical protein F2Q68_00017200 [Brassica cretica]|uniref:Uncharacterized protein n=1 Tax=Brassica cretica TaxID=69181 RepID=A0A8S9HHB4_BRACR|nr:hypothetical protein F2Q68_00017200 [Brassica cretica]